MQRSAERLVRLLCSDHRASEGSLLVVNLGRRREVTRRHGWGGVRNLLDVVCREESLSTVDFTGPPVRVRLLDYFDDVAWLE